MCVCVCLLSAWVVCLLSVWVQHCPWTSKCIGRKNITDFYVFLVCAFGTVIYLTVCMGVYIRNTSVIHT